MQKGSGIDLVQGYTFNTALIYFVTNSICRILSIASSGGILLKLILQGGVVSPYISTNSNSVGSPITEIILKIIYLHNTNELEIIHSSRRLFFQNNTTTDEFRDEVNTQINIFRNSLDIYLEPICPAIVYANIFSSHNNHDLTNVLDTLESKSIDEGNNMPILYFQRIRNLCLMQMFHIGIIAMESFTNTVTLGEIATDPALNIPQADIITYKYMALYEICRLFNIGYLHGDPHMNNILINRDYNYFNGTVIGYGLIGSGLGRAILIDFGSTFRHNQGAIQISNNFEDLDNFDLYRNIQQSLLITSPRYQQGLAATHLSWQWLRMPEIPNRIDLNTGLFFLTIQRKITKMVFFIHLGINYNGHQIHPLIGGQISEQVSEKHDTNIFDKLDPKHILTVPFIEDYIKKQNDFSNDILKELMNVKEITDIKGGYNKRNTTKKRKTKKRKN
jgi:hypothetical protein